MYKHIKYYLLDACEHHVDKSYWKLAAKYSEIIIKFLYFFS